MPNTLYICGDSFCAVDPGYGACWIDLLADSLPTTKIVNLSIPGASNYLIYLQVKQALEENCDYLIYHATSSIRQEFSINAGDIQRDTIDRYWSPYDQNNKSAMCNSWIHPNQNANNLFADTEDTIQDFFVKHIDFTSQIEKNYIMIDYTLDKISKNSVVKNWVWSQGGFEHPKFNSKLHWDFSKYKSHESSINLWDEYDQTLTRPYYHVTDKQIHKKVCEYYLNMLQL